MKEGRLKDQICVIFGGATGIGFAIARGFVREGAIVIPVGRRAERLEQAIRELGLEGQVPVLRTDATDERQVQSTAETLERCFGRVDVLVNSQGTIVRKPALDLSPEDWDRVVNTNLRSLFLTCVAFGRGMIARRKGKIINIASLASELGLSEVLPYCASKAGVMGLTRSLAIEWAPYNVQVNAIIPGVFITDLNREIFEKDPQRLQRILNRIPMGRTGQVEELQEVALLLASSGSDYITGQSIAVDGGLLAYGF